MIPTLPGQRTLLCILDWGLGHASRSLALAAALEAAGETTFFASCGRAKKFLEAERPGLVVHELPAYNVTYPTRSMPLNVAWQFPRWARTIWRERRCCEKLVEELGIDRIVSDNRFGCYAPGVSSIFLTHQLHPITGNALVSWVYRRYLQRFDGFWVPDFVEHEQRVSGKLSDTKGYENVAFIGPLSRLAAGHDDSLGLGKSSSDLDGISSGSSETSSGWRGVAPGDFFSTAPPHAKEMSPPGSVVLALLSGPEPMRTQLEDIILRQLPDLPGQHMLIRGLPGGAAPIINQPANVTVHDFADTKLLAQLLPNAQHIICRSGYSTLMDVYAVAEGKNLVLVPTPGQTEQVYLAEREAKRIGCRAVFEQEELDISSLG